MLTQLLIMLQGNLEASQCTLVGFQGPQRALGRTGVLSVLIIVIRGASVSLSMPLNLPSATQCVLGAPWDPPRAA